MLRHSPDELTSSPSAAHAHAPALQGAAKGVPESVDQATDPHLLQIIAYIESCNLDHKRVLGHQKY